MKLSKEESYKQLLHSWIELIDQIPGDVMVPVDWAVKLAEQLGKTKKALGLDLIPPSDEPPVAE